MELIKPLNKKVSMFATNDELYDQLTNKEIMAIKLAKVDEFVDDLYSYYHPNLPADKIWFKIKELLKELNQLND